LYSIYNGVLGGYQGLKEVALFNCILYFFSIITLASQSTTEYNPDYGNLSTSTPAELCKCLVDIILMDFNTANQLQINSIK
jgi:hypothetical protein